MKKLFVILCLMLFAVPALAVPSPSEQARTYSEGLGFTVKGIPQCSDTDSDNDGYVSCTVRLAEPMKDGTEIIELECGYSYVDGCDNARGVNGCKSKMPKTNVTVNRYN